MNWQAVWNKAKYAIVPLACLAAIAIAVAYGTGRETGVERKKTRTVEKSGRSRLDRIDPDAAKKYNDALATHLSRMDRLAAQRTAQNLVRTMARLETGRISLDDARASTTKSALGMLTQGNFRMEMGEISKETENPSPKNTPDWLDRILDANPRKFLFVIVIALVAVLLAGAILGKSEIRKVAWSIAIILIAFLVVNQFWKSGGSTFAQGNSISAQRQSMRQKNVITVEVSDKKWSREITLLPSIPFTWDDQPGDLYFKFPNGKIIKTEKGGYADLGKMPSRKFRVKGTPGTVVFVQ